MAAGPHIVRKLRKGKPAVWYVYAWRGGPLAHRAEGGRPRMTAELRDAIAEARNQRHAAPGVVAGLVEDYLKSPEWEKLSPTTRATWRIWLDRIRERFGPVKLGGFNDRRARGLILEWRDRWRNQPRSADMAMQVLSRLLAWGMDRGQLTMNVAAGVAQLYEHDRSEIVWRPEDFERFAGHASIEVQEAVELAACTGLRRGDLVALPWSAIGEHAIVWKTAKSRGRRTIYVPLLPEAKALLARIRARAGAAGRALPASVLSNSRWQPWTASGLGSRFNDAKLASGLALHLHDLRGTFATRCMLAGLNDREIAEILGWSPTDVAAIRMKYVDQARVVIAIGERIARAKA